MKRKILVASAVLLGLVLAYAPAWYTHRKARRDVYWKNVAIGVVEVDADGFRELGALPEVDLGPITPMTVEGLTLGLPLEGFHSLKITNDEAATSVIVLGDRRVLGVTKLKEAAFAPANVTPDMASLRELAAARAPSYLWPLLPSSIAQGYLRYALKAIVLGGDRRLFNNGTVVGVIGRAGLYTVTFPAPRALLQVKARDEQTAMGIARGARPAKEGAAPEAAHPRLVDCIACTIEERADCKAHCDGLDIESR